jgi:hypothetical protein
MHEPDPFGVVLTGPRFGRILARMSTITTKDGAQLYYRRSLLVGGATAALAAMGGCLVDAASKPAITVHKSPT